MSELLRIDQLDVGYGDFQALFGIDLHVAEAETVSIIGANGAGKSTLLKAIVGLVQPMRGDILLRRHVRRIAACPPARRRRHRPGSRRPAHLPVAHRRGEHRHRWRRRPAGSVEQGDGARGVSAADAVAEAVRRRACPEASDRRWPSPGR